MTYLFDPIHLFKLGQLLLVLFLFLRFRPTKVWLFMLLCVPLLSLLIRGSYESGDFNTHIVRSMDLYSSLRDGVFPVRWAWLLHGGYGYSLFNFVSVLPYYFVALFVSAGLSFISSLKLYLGLMYLVGGIGMYLLCLQLYSKKGAVAGAILYSFSPYMLINIHFRGAAGEAGGIAILPWIFYAVLRNRTLLYTAALAFLFLVHPGVTLLATPWIVMFLFVQKKFKRFLIPSLLATGMSAFYLFPAFIESKHSQQVLEEVGGKWNDSVFSQPIDLIWSQWRYGFLFQGPQGELSSNLGVLLVIGTTFALTLIVLRAMPQKTRMKLGFWLLMSCVAVFFLLRVSLPVWNQLDMLRKLQFPSRFLSLWIVGASVVSAYFFVRMKKKALVILLWLIVSCTALNWTHRRYDPGITDEFLWNSIPVASFIHERLPSAMPVWKGYIESPRAVALTIESGEGTVISNEQHSIRRTYILDASTDLIVRENTLYFPGWVARVDGIDAEIQISGEGVMETSVPAGKHKLDFLFEDTPVRKTSNVISLISTGLFIVLLVRSRYV